MAPQNHEALDDESGNSLASSAEEDSEMESEKEVVKSTPDPILQSDSEGEDDEADEDEDNEEGSAEEEVSLRSPTASDFTIKPNILTKPAQKNSNPASKRPLEAPKVDAKESRTKKKAKIKEKNPKKDKVSSVSVSGPSAPRVWSEEHELALLQGMIDYRSQKGSDPYANMNAFSDFVKGNLFSGIVKSQIYEKLRRLKAKFLKNQGKGEDGRDPVFSNPREIKTFELSKKVWGDDIKSNELEHKPKVKSNNVEDNGKVKSNLSNRNAKVRTEKERREKDDKVILEKERTEKDDKAILEKEGMKKNDNVIMEKERTKKDDKGGSFLDGLANNMEENGKVKSNLLNSKAKASREKKRTKKDDKEMEKESTKKDGKASMGKESTKKDGLGASFVAGLADGVDMQITNCNQRLDKSSDFLSNYPYLSLSFDVETSFLKDNLHLIGDVKAKELEEGWTKLQMEEMELVSKRLSLMAKQTEMVLDAVKKG